MKTDSQIQQDVMDELRWEPSVDATHIGVTVGDGVVTLMGDVPSFAEKMAAERAAMRVQNVRAVVEKIEVKLPGSSKRSDVDIARAAADALRWDAWLPDDSVHVKVEDGIIKLTGETPREYQRRHASDAVRHLKGVRGVINLIVVRPRATAAGIREKIEAAFERTAERDAARVTVIVEGGTVTVKGVVHSYAEKHEAERVAWSAPGVTSVKNEIEVRPYAYA